MKYMKYYLCIGLVFILVAACAPTGDQVTETKDEKVIESSSEEVEEPKGEVPDDIKEIFDKSKTKLKSYSYHYSTPEIETSYKIYVKGNKMKIEYPQRVYYEKTKFYNVVYLDTEEKTAESYCVGHNYCDGDPGRKIDVNYDDVYIETPVEWLDKVTEAEKIDERRVENRDCVYLESNIGKIIVETYYGFLYSIENDDGITEFRDAALNTVSDEDVVP